MYSWSIPASASAATICSDSACLTRGSLAPWAISSGMRMSRARDSGDRDHRNSLSVSGFPTRLYSCALAGAQYGGIVSSSVCRFDGPTISTAQRNTAGVDAAPPSPRAAPVEAAVDRDPVPVGPALLHHVPDRVDQVVVHLGAPLTVAGVDERLAVAGRSAVVHLDGQVAAVGEPLRLGVPAPYVA